MIVTVAKTAGFCFGVTRAVDLCVKTTEAYGSCKTIGPIIHNESVVRHLAEKGAVPVDSVFDIQAKDVVVIRSHGITKAEREILDNSNCMIIDATCPFVARIHEIVTEESQKGYFILIIGEANHPEVKGIASRCMSFSILSGPEELDLFLKNSPEIRNTPLVMVSQTTGNKNNYEKCSIILKKTCTNIKIFDTICLTTSMRQKEAAELSTVSDAMIVIGGQKSANTLRLAEICRQSCQRVYMIETVADLDVNEFSPLDRIGVTAGASTPS